MSTPSSEDATTPTTSSSSTNNNTPPEGSSLAILLAERDLTLKEPTRKTANAIHLEKLMARLIGHIAAHDFENPELQEYLVDDFTAFLEYMGKPLLEGRQAFLEHFKRYVTLHPEYTLEVESVVADVNEKNGTATVWSLLNVTGETEGVRRQSVTVHSFRRKGGRWRAYKQTGIRGMAAYL